MSPEDRERLDALTASTKAMEEALHLQGQQLALFSKSLIETMTKVNDPYARAHILSHAVAALIAEMADSDQERLDALLARTTAAGEEYPFGNGIARATVLGIIDELRGQAEAYFFDRNR